MRVDERVMSSPGGSERDALRATERLLLRNERDRGMSVLDGLLAERPSDETLHADAVAICLTFGLHDEALSILDRYRAYNGAEARSDHSREEILALRTQAEDHEALPGERKVFRRMSLFERGRQSGLWLLPFRRAVRSLPGILDPPRRITISPDGITIRRWGRSHHHPWADLNSARIEERELRTRYERFTHRVLVLDTPSRTYLIDVSANRPDFRGNTELLRELGARLDLG